MNRRNFLSKLISLLSVSVLQKSSPAYAQTRPFVIGVFPRRNIKVTHKMFFPLREYLSDVLGREVKIETTKSFAEFWKNVGMNKYDLVHYNQYHYIVSNLLFGYEVILKNKEQGKSTIAGSIIVRKDSEINEVADLKGKVILFGGSRRAMQSYISATWLLRQAGLNEGDYIEKFAINPPNTIISTFFKRADASGSGDVVMYLDNVAERIDITQLKFLAKTKPMSHLPWAVNSKMEDETKVLIQKKLIDLSQTKYGKMVLQSAKLDSFVSAKDSDYDQHREIIVDVYGRDYGVSKLR